MNKALQTSRRTALIKAGFIALAGACALALPVMAKAQATVPRAFDPATLTPDNFYQVLEPIARREARLVFYNTAGNFDPVWKTSLIPRFEARYGVKVEYHNVRRDQANQQLSAVHKAGKPSPVDVYFAGGPDNLETLRGVIAPYPLATLLPNLSAVPAEYKDTVYGVATQGRWPIVHRSQLVLGYDSSLVAERDLPRSFEALLAWAKAHPKKLAFTSPVKGGSGAGFVYSAALQLATDAVCKPALVDARWTYARAEAWALQAKCLDPLWAYLARLVKAAELTNGNADTLNLLNNRQAWMGTTWEDLALTFVRARQLPESFRVSSLAGGLISGGDGLVIAANAQSPAAALLFIDMAFGREFQAWKLEQHASRSPRPDIDAAALVSPQTARHLLSPEQARQQSVPANWTVTRALARAFEDKVLARP